MILIADSGSTKTDWALVDQETTLRFNTQGINPVHQKREAILQILHEELFRIWMPTKYSLSSFMVVV